MTASAAPRTPPPVRRACVLAVGAALALALPAAAQTVALTGMMGNRALLVIDGGAPRALAAGDSAQGVRLLSVGDAQAVVEVGGQRQTVLLGGSPVSVGARQAPGAASSAPGQRIVLMAGSGGHFMTQGQINGRAASFMVDTGATAIGMGVADAQRLGINYERAGVLGRVTTANGTVPAWRVRLDSVRIGEVEVHGVEAFITPLSMPHILLGNSFLSRFQMARTNDQMVLTRRY